MFNIDIKIKIYCNNYDYYNCKKSNRKIPHGNNDKQIDTL